MTTFLGVADNAEGTLLAGINSAVTSFDLGIGQGSKFPAANFVITCGSEMMLCSSRLIDTLTVTRAYNSTLASDHDAGAKVQLRVIAKHISDITSH